MVPTIEVHDSHVDLGDRSESSHVDVVGFLVHGLDVSGAELFDRHSAFDETLVEIGILLQVHGGQETQEDDHVIRVALEGETTTALLTAASPGKSRPI